MAERTEKIAIVRYCKECPHFDYVFKSNWRDTDNFNCGALNKWLHGRVYSFHKECPLKDVNRNRQLHRAIFIDRLKQHCESVREEKNYVDGEHGEATHVLAMIKGFEVSLTDNEIQVIELLRMSLNERVEQDCDYEEYYGRDGCPEIITRHHYRCDGCRAREILKEIEQLEKGIIL